MRAILFRSLKTSEQPVAGTTSSMLRENGMLYGQSSRHIPTELLVHIFSLSLPDHDRRLRTSRHLLPPFTLSQVCHSWRTLVLNTPRLWSDIDTTIYGTKSDRACRDLQLWASRAGDTPISIRHTPYIFDGLHILLAGATSGVYETETTAFMEAIAGLAKRLRYLTLNVLNTDVLEPLFRLINIDRPSESDGATISQQDLDALSAFPLLEELDLSSTHLGILAEEYSLENIDIACPRLRRLSLLAPANIPGEHVKAMQSMRSLDLKFVTALSHCLRWIQICPNLENLSLGLFCRDEVGQVGDNDWMDQLEREEMEVESELDGDDEGWVIVPEPRPQPQRRIPASTIVHYHLHRLTTLNIWVCSSPGDLAYLLSDLEAPALTVFRVATSVISQSNARWPSVLDFIRRSRPHLDEFECSGTLMVPEDVRASLALLPDLRVLKLGKSREVDAVLSHMVAPESGEVLCPKLEGLSLEESTFSMDILAAMVSSRCGAMDTGSKEVACQPLKMLRMDDRYVDAAKEHPLMLECLSRGLKLERVPVDRREEPEY